MPAWRPELYKPEDVVTYYENRDGYTSYKIYAGTKPDPNFCRFEYLGDEKQEGLKTLEEACNVIASSPLNINPYLLQIFRDEQDLQELNKKKLQALDSICISFQFNGHEKMIRPYEPENLGGFAQQNNNAIFQLLEQNKLILEELKEQRVRLQELEEQEPVGSMEKETTNPLMDLLTQPALQPLIMSLADRLSEFLLPKKIEEQQQPQVNNFQQQHN